jgi:hypothetical protein
MDPSPMVYNTTAEIDVRPSISLSALEDTLSNIAAAAIWGGAFFCLLARFGRIIRACLDLSLNGDPDALEQFRQVQTVNSVIGRAVEQRNRITVRFPFQCADTSRLSLYLIR